MASLNILCLDLHNFLKEITRKKKKERSTSENFLWFMKNFQKYFMAHQYSPKFFVAPAETFRLSPPIYLMYGPTYHKLKNFLSCDTELIL